MGIPKGIQNAEEGLHLIDGKAGMGINAKTCTASPQP